MNSQLVFLECLSERMCSSARYLVALMVSANIEATTYPRIEPNAGVSGHVCDIQSINLRQPLYHIKYEPAMDDPSPRQSGLHRASNQRRCQ